MWNRGRNTSNRARPSRTFRTSVYLWQILFPLSFLCMLLPTIPNSLSFTLLLIPHSNLSLHSFLFHPSPFIKLSNFPFSPSLPVTPLRQTHQMKPSHYYGFQSKFASEKNAFLICYVTLPSSATHPRTKEEMFHFIEKQWLLGSFCPRSIFPWCENLNASQKFIELLLPIIVRRRPLPCASRQISKVSQGATVPLSLWVSG